MIESIDLFIDLITKMKNESFESSLILKKSPSQELPGKNTSRAIKSLLPIALS